MNRKINGTSNSNHEVSLTNEGWNGLQSIAKNLDLSVSELLEKVGRGQMMVLDSEELEDILDTIDGLEGLLEAKEEESIPWEQAKAELGL